MAVRAQIDQVKFQEFIFEYLEPMTIHSLLAWCMIKIFRGGGKGWWMGRGVAVKGA